MCVSIYETELDGMGMCPNCFSENYSAGICGDCGYINMSRRCGYDGPDPKDHK